MKLLSAWLLLISLTLMTKAGEGQVRPTPPQVTSVFTNMFPDAGNVLWRDKITNFCAYFTIRDVKCEAKFNPDGKWICTEKSIPWDSLPRLVADSLTTGKYADWKGNSAYILQSAAGTTQYHVVVTNKDMGRKLLFFDQNGQQLSDHLITEVFSDIETGKFEQANTLLADDFRALLLGKEVNRPIYISAFRSLHQGIPDLKLTIQNVKSDGDRVTAKLKITGTNSHSIPALLKGWHDIPPTHKKVEGLTADLEITLKDGKIEEIRNVKNTGGVFVRLLENLGLDYKKFQEN